MASDPLHDAEALLDTGDPRAAYWRLHEAEDAPRAAVVRAEAASRLGRWQEARDEASRALAGSETLADQVRAWTLIASAEGYGGRVGAARQRLRDAHGALAGSDHPGLAGIVFRETARLELQLGRATEAEAAITQAEAAALAAGSHRLMASLRLLRAQARVDRSDLVGAKFSLEEAMNLYHRLDHHEGQAWAHLALASWYLVRGSLGSGQDHTRAGFEAFKKLRHPLGMARALDLRGELARAHGRTDDAAQSYGQSIAALRATDQPALRARLHLALTLRDRHRVDDARSTLLTVLTDAERFKRRRLLPTIHAALLATAADQGDEERLLHHLREAHDLLHETHCATADAARLAGDAGDAAGQHLSTSSLSLAVRAHGLSLAFWHHLSDDQAAVGQARTLRRLSERGAPIPCGDWDLLEMIGYGAMGEVWRARHHLRGTEAAVKLMLRGEAGNRRLATLIAAEVRAVAGLHHPHIVEVLDHGHLSTTAEVLTAGRQRAETPWFAVTLARGGTLEARCGELNWPDCRRILLALLDALAHAHARGVVHLDLKPANVLLDPGQEGDTVLLTDFGLAGALAMFTGSTGLLGTPYTMSPEQFARDRHRFGPWTDLYALGCLAYHLVQGRPPFPGRTMESLRRFHLEEPPPPVQARVAIPHGLQAWLSKLMAKDPTDRYPCAADAAFALDALGPADIPPEDDRTEPPPAHLAVSSLSLTHVGDESVDSFSHPSGPPVPSDWRMSRSAPTALRAGASLDLFRVRRPPMVGQKTARDAAWKAIATATQRQAPVILGVEGPPGSGRSRLLSWLTELAHERGAAQVVLVEEQEHLWPALVRAAVDLREPQPSAEAYEDQISSLVPELGTYIVRVLANAAAQVPGPPEPTAGAVAQALRLRARRRPLLVAMEGPWLDRPEAHAFLHAVADLPSPVVLALECSAVAPLPPTEATTVAVHLTPTSDADLAQILDDLLPLEPQLTASVVRRAQGNPQLAIELVTDLVDRQLLLWRHGRYGLREGVVLDLPEGTREVWRQRLERALVGVVDSERTAVVLGALLGGPVPIDRWEQAARRMGLVEYQEVLGRLQRAWLVELEGDRWRFVHPVLEEVTQSLAEEAGSLSEACLAAAYVLTEASGPPGRIGRLLGRAGAHAASLAPLGLGIDDALQSGDLDAVAQLLDRRAHALHHLGAGSHDPRWLPNALGHGGLALERGDVRTARREAERAVRLAGSDGGDARAYLLHGRALQRDGRPGEARDAYSDALHHAVSDDRLLGRILFGLGELLRTQGELEAAEVHLEMAAEHVRDDPATRAAVQLAQGRVAVARGALDEAARWVTEAETWCRHLSLRRLLVAALILRGDVHRWREELIQAGQCFDQARLLCAGHESVLLATVEVQHGLACLAGRNDEEAVRHFDRADAAAQRPQADRLLLARLPMATHGSDRAFDRALDQVRRALDRHPDDPDHAFCLEVAADRARKARRKQILWAMAAEVWRSLGRPRRASLAERALATLARS